MKQREFEHDVKEKMDAFDLHPSDEVWQQVELRIRKEKKRRLIFWWPLFFLLMAGGAATYFNLKRNNNTDEKIISKKQERIINQPTTKNEKVEPDIVKSQSESGIRELQHKQVDAITSKKEENVDIVTPIKRDIHVSGLLAPTHKKTKTSPITNDNPSALNEKDVAARKKNPSNKSNSDLTVTDSKNLIEVGHVKIASAVISDNKPQVTTKNNNSITPNQQNDTKAGVENKKTEEQVFDSVSISSEAPVKMKKNNKWSKGLKMSIGNSSLADGFTVLNKSFEADAFTGGAPSFAPLINRSISSVKKGPSFAIGFFMQKPVSKKLTLNVGADYTYLSWRLNVGARVDTLINAGSFGGLVTSTTNRYYRLGATTNNRYTNQYHFLGLSSQLSWRLIDKKRFQFAWDNGIAFKRLVGSNMIHYNSQLQGYYKNNSLLVKNQFFYSSGFSISTGRQFLFGPMLNYGLSPVLKNNIGAKRHYSSIDIGFKWVFKK